MILNYLGKNAIVAGSSGGMGLDISKKLSQNKIKTLMLDIKEPPKNFLKKNKYAIFNKIDLTNFNELKKIIDKFYKENNSIDYLVNTTGVLWFEKDISLIDIDFGIWDKVFNINLKTMVYLSKLIIPKMKKNKFGSMVHISSIDALSGDNKPQDAYGSSKAAMIRLSKSIAIQFADYNCRSNVVLPGAINTPMQDRWKKQPKLKKNIEKSIPLKRVGKPQDISNSVMFLLSDESQYITGTEIIVDGGVKAKP